MGWPAAYAPMAFSVYVVQTMAFMLIVPRPHTAIGKVPPITRVNNLAGHHV
jgi:hypothetical protein